MQYYDFTIDGARVGYFEIEEGPGELYMNARMRLADGVHENPFWLRHVGGRPMHVKARGSEWRDVPAGTFPTCAYPLVLRAGLRSYRAFVETTGALEDRVLRSEDGREVEYAGDVAVRSFVVHGDEIVYIGWGGTSESRLVGSRAEAVKGTGFV
jgi:hypothetical protein